MLCPDVCPCSWTISPFRRLNVISRESTPRGVLGKDSVTKLLLLTGMVQGMELQVYGGSSKEHMMVKKCLRNVEILQSASRRNSVVVACKGAL